MPELLDAPKSGITLNISECMSVCLYWLISTIPPEYNSFFESKVLAK